MTRPNVMHSWADWVAEQVGAEAVRDASLVQPLWGDYGQLWRVYLEGGLRRSVILKEVSPPDQAGSVSDLRKRRSYEVELAWYQEVASSCDESCRVAELLGHRRDGESSQTILEDLACSGFKPLSTPRDAHAVAGLSWLASFHARFLNRSFPLLWEEGTYWHLSTRQEELERMPVGDLKSLAGKLDSALRGANYQTLVHGDAKTTNFCWDDQSKAAAVDFQYVGRGCGIRDVALFLDRAVGGQRLVSEEAEWLNIYFEFLTQRLDSGLGAEVEKEWRPLFCVAWTDYARFRQGWSSPGPLDRYSQVQLELAGRVLIPGVDS